MIPCLRFSQSQEEPHARFFSRRLAKRGQYDRDAIIEVAFALNGTGSIGPLIEAAKRKISSIAAAIDGAAGRGDAALEKRLNAGLGAAEDEGVDVVRALVGVHGL